MEQSLAGKVTELEIEYGKWARENILLHDNSIIAFVYSVKMGQKINEYDREEIINGVKIKFAATTQEEMYEAILEHTRNTLKDSHWFISVNVWWNFFRGRRKDPNPWLVPTGKLTIGVGVVGILVTDGRKLVKTYGHEAMKFIITEKQFIVKLKNKNAYNIVQSEDNNLRYQTIIEHHFTQLCRNIDLGIEKHYRDQLNEHS